MSESVSDIRTLPVARQSSAATVAMAIIIGAALYPFGLWLWQGFSDQVVGLATSLIVGLETYVRSVAGAPL